jgi:exosortase A
MSTTFAHEDLPRAAVSGESPAATASGARWPLFLGAIVLAFVAYWPTLSSVLRRWTGDPTYSHGYLVAAIAGWLVWRAWRRGELEGTRPSWFGLLPLALAGLVWLIARGASIQVVQQLMLPAFLLGVAWAMFGWRGFAALLVPIGVVYFVMPAWDVIRIVLQDLTTDAVGQFLHAVGVPAFITGHRVDLPSGSFEIVEGCSGLHFFMAAAALAAIQAYVFIGAHWARAVLMAAALFVAIIANWIRVAAVIVAGHMTEMQHFLVVKDHYYFGWVVFALLMIPVIYLGRRLEDRAPLPPAPASAPPLSFHVSRELGAPAAAALGVLVLPALAWWAAYHAAEIDTPPELPVAKSEFRLLGGASPDWRPRRSGTSLTLNGLYTDGVREVDAWLDYYARQFTGHELIGHGNAPARRDDGRLSSDGLAPGELRLMTGSGRDRLIRFRYVVNGEVTASATRAKLLQVAGNLGGRPSAYALTLSARCGAADCADARDALDVFEAGMRGALPGLPAE